MSTNSMNRVTEMTGDYRRVAVYVDSITALLQANATDRVFWFLRRPYPE